MLACGAWYRHTISVCLSIQCWYCVETKVHTIRLFPQFRTAIILAFNRDPPALEKSQWESLSGTLGVKIHSYSKNVFSTKSLFISETVRYRPVVIMDHKYEMLGIQSIHVGSNDLERHLKEGCKWPNFASRSLYIYSYCLTKNDQIWHVTHVEEGCISRGSALPHPQGRAPAFS